MSKASLIAKKIINGEIRTLKELQKEKMSLGVKRTPNNCEILKKIPKKYHTEKVLNLLKTKPVRSKSGVNVIAIMCKPHKCPHGRCSYCPESMINKKTPPSYTGNEPATMRAIFNDFDAYKQVQNRLKQYYLTGHVPEKIELIIMGGTFNSLNIEYQNDFIRDAYQALNDYPEKKKERKNLKEVIKENENSKHRCVALVIETRPDTINETEIKRFLEYGVTRIELGVQSVYDEVLEKVSRGHGVNETIKIVELLRNAGFKIDFHIMLGLPFKKKLSINERIKKDVQMIETLFNNSSFMPDGLKIYPTMLVKNTKLYEEFVKGEYVPINDEYVIKVLTQAKPRIPKWCRIKRVLRDIPLSTTEGNIKTGNLREIVWKELKKKGLKCNCIRCREIGHVNITRKIKEKLNITKYSASNGEEYFISIDDENNDALLSFCRLRLSRTAIIRELHSYGFALPLSKNFSEGSFQNKGYGRKLLRKAEEIARKKGYKELRVISGVGVREYYRKQGYELKDNYMIKKL